MSYNWPVKIRLPRGVGIAVIVVLLGALIYWKAQQNYTRQDYVNSNFFSFWLSGHMVWTGESPYNTAQWMAGFDAAGATYRPSKILQYPLPLMYFMAPIGSLPVGQAYFAWQLICQITIALSVLLLLRLAHSPAWLVLPIAALLLFFGPVYLSLQVGSVGVISLLAVTLALVLLASNHPLPAGILLSLTLLKPPQALTLLALIGFWLLVRRLWRAIAGLAIGALALLVIWVLRDPLWLVKFRGSSDFLLGHSLGVQSNVFGFAYLACARNAACMWVLGPAAAVIILALGAYLLWRNRRRWSDWEAFNLAIPLGFLTALYLWSYDQLLYVIPLVWLVSRLILKPRGYILAFAFLVLLDLVSLVALGVQAFTGADLLSVLTTLIVLGVCTWLVRRPAARTPDIAAPA